MGNSPSGGTEVTDTEVRLAMGENLPWDYFLPPVTSRTHIHYCILSVVRKAQLLLNFTGVVFSNRRENRTFNFVHISFLPDLN